MTMTVAIHQPNFFPWLGYFEKIMRSDCFIFLDDVQIQKTGGGWSNRVRMLVSGAPRWVTAPIERNYHGGRAINETHFFEKSSWRDDVFRTIQQNYKNAPHYDDAIELVKDLLLNPERNLAEYNVRAIVAIAHELQIPHERFRRSSELAQLGQSNEYLINLVKSVGGESYLCGGGADSYQDEDMFSRASISLVRQNFTMAPYFQQGSASFNGGLSIIDALMNLGLEGTKSLLLSSHSKAFGQA